VQILLWRLTGLTVGLLLLSSPMAAQTHRQNTDPCRDTSKMTQRGLNECAGKELRNTELKMDRLLKQLGINRDDPAQKAWEAYRDAQLAALYPQEDISSFGSVYPMCFTSLKQVLTEGRIRDLKALIRQEGDVCSGYRAAD
jgi:uncharacterized protein YecT (DUF1311 family)